MDSETCQKKTTMRKDHDKDSNRRRETEGAASHLLQILVDRDVGHDDTLAVNGKQRWGYLQFLPIFALFIE